jgi:hypothetical protein
MFELASALLRRFWTDCAGEVRVSGELPAILAVMLGIFCLSSQLVFPLAAQEIALIRGASAAVCGHSERGTGAGNHGEAWCARSGTLDITCDALEDSR